MCVTVGLCGCQFVGYTFAAQGGMGGDVLRGHVRKSGVVCRCVPMEDVWVCTDDYTGLCVGLRQKDECVYKCELA